MTTIGYAVLQIIPSLKGVSDAIEKQLADKPIPVTIEPKFPDKGSVGRKKLDKAITDAVKKSPVEVPIEPKVDAKKAGEKIGKDLQQSISGSGGSGSVAGGVGKGIEDAIGKVDGKKAGTKIGKDMSASIKAGVGAQQSGQAIGQEIADGVKKATGGALKDALKPGLDGAKTEIKAWGTQVGKELASGEVKTALDDVGQVVKKTTTAIDNVGKVFGADLGAGRVSDIVLSRVDRVGAQAQGFIDQFRSGVSGAHQFADAVKAIHSGDRRQGISDSLGLVDKAGQHLGVDTTGVTDPLRQATDTADTFAQTWLELKGLGSYLPESLMGRLAAVGAGGAAVRALATPYLPAAASAAVIATSPSSEAPREIGPGATSLFYRREATRRYAQQFGDNKMPQGTAQWLEGRGSLPPELAPFYQSTPGVVPTSDTASRLGHFEQSVSNPTPYVAGTASAAKSYAPGAAPAPGGGGANVQAQQAVVQAATATISSATLSLAGLSLPSAPSPSATSGSTVRPGFSSWYSSSSNPTTTSQLLLPSHDTGTRELPSDEIAQLHKGEVVLPTDIVDAAGGADNVYGTLAMLGRRPQQPTLSSLSGSTTFGSSGGLGLASLGVQTKVTPDSPERTFDLGSVIGSAIGGQGSAAFSAFGIPKPHWGQAISQFVSGIRIGGGPGSGGGPGFGGGAIPGLGGGGAIPSSLGASMPGPAGIPGLNGAIAGQFGPQNVNNWNISTARVEDAFMEARRKADVQALTPLDHL